MDGVVLPEGSRAIVFYGAANRDERKYPDPNRFDVLRRPGDHLGFGAGPHACVGMNLARIEMLALKKSWERFAALSCRAGTSLATIPRSFATMVPWRKTSF
jgi:cytochrome P450